MECHKAFEKKKHKNHFDPNWLLVCSMGRPFEEETTILAKTLCHP